MLEMENTKINRKTKDSVFTKLFGERKYAFQLYQSLHPEDKDCNEKDLDIITLENIFTNGFYNDLGLLMNNHLMILVEAQSKWNGNMSVRALLYLAHTYERFIHQKEIDLMTSKKVKLPNPEFYVIYTGPKDVCPKEEKISDHFINLPGQKKEETLELKVKIIYNYDKEDIISQYITFCKIFDEQIRKFPCEGKFAVQETLRICKEKHTLEGFIKLHEAEVSTIMYGLIFDEKLLREIHEKSERRIAREEGLAEGRAEGRAEGLVEGREEQKKIDEAYIAELEARIKELEQMKNNRETD